MTELSYCLGVFPNFSIEKFATPEFAIKAGCNFVILNAYYPLKRFNGEQLLAKNLKGLPIDMGLFKITNIRAKDKYSEYTIADSIGIVKLIDFKVNIDGLKDATIFLTSELAGLQSWKEYDLFCENKKLKEQINGDNHETSP